jgi:hypothetical protein
MRKRDSVDVRGRIQGLFYIKRGNVEQHGQITRCEGNIENVQQQRCGKC